MDDSKKIGIKSMTINSPAPRLVQSTSTTNKNQAWPALAWSNPNLSDEPINAHRAHGSGRLRGLHRRKKIVKLLNADDAGVRNVPGLQLLQPLASDLGSPGNFSPRQGRGAQKFESSLKDGLGHVASLGKTLPKSSGQAKPDPEALYLNAPVIFSRMRAETLDNVRAALASNAKALKKTLNLSNADILGKDGKNVSNIIREEHDPRISTVVKIAHALGVETWQILLSDLPEIEGEFHHLSQIVRGFIKLGPKLRETLLHNVENEARGQHRTSEIFGAPLPKVANSN